jgi:hypothetical protein
VIITVPTAPAVFPAPVLGGPVPTIHPGALPGSRCGHTESCPGASSTGWSSSTARLTSCAADRVTLRSEVQAPFLFPPSSYGIKRGFRGLCANWAGPWCESGPLPTGRHPPMWMIRRSGPGSSPSEALAGTPRPAARLPDHPKKMMTCGRP